MQELVKSLLEVKSTEKQERNTVLNNKNQRNIEVKAEDKLFDEYNWHPDNL